MKNAILLITFCMGATLVAQTGLFEKKNFTRADSLRGGLRPERTAFNIYYYDLSIDLDIPNKFISGTVDIYFQGTQELSDRIQIDLFKNLKVKSIQDLNGTDLTYTRDENAIFIDLDENFMLRTQPAIRISYEGTPTAAQNPPWDGGLVWRKDKNGNPWVTVACQGIGASLWWPCKDHQSDEADSVKISITHPSDLVAICNGNLRGITKLDNNRSKTTWAVTYPINNYNVTLNVGKYVNFNEKYKGVETTFDLDYYVLDYNLDKAKQHFKQVIPMMKAYEEMLGPYPFPRDGFGLVETPYLGMEHQGAIAYGNKFKWGYDGYPMSGLDIDFDFIIIHESGHEYWGNSVGSQDIADMWVHEGFCTYSEALYIEYLHGKDTALLYCNGWKMAVENDKPIIGNYGLNSEGSGDMYNKAALMLHTLRWQVNDDKKWFATIKGIQKDFRFKTVSGDEIIAYMNTQLGKDYTWLFNQYLKKASPPVLNYQLEQNGRDLDVTMKWDKVDDDFCLPVTVKISAKKTKTYVITNVPQKFTVKKMNYKNFKVDDKHSYFLYK